MRRLTIVYATLPNPFANENLPISARPVEGLNAMYLGEMPVISIQKNVVVVPFGEVRLRSGGLIEKPGDLSVFVRNDQAEWIQTYSDDEYVPVLGDGFIFMKFMNFAAPPRIDPDDDGDWTESLDEAFDEILSATLTPSGTPPPLASSSSTTSSSSSSTRRVPGTNPTADRERTHTSSHRRSGEHAGSEDDFNIQEAAKEAAEKARLAAMQISSAFTSWAKQASQTVQSVGELAKLANVETIEGVHKVKIVKKLAEGGFSEVFVVRYVVPTSQTSTPSPQGVDLAAAYALKRCRAQTREQLAMLKREVEAHKLVPDEVHVLRLIASDVVAESSERAWPQVVRMLFPLCEGGSWHDLAYHRRMGQRGEDPEREAMHIFVGTCRGLLALHERARLLHRDVKPHNVLLTASGEAVLMDLGSNAPWPMRVPNRSAATLLAEECAEQCSAPFRAPDLYEPGVGSEMGPEVDVWSLGATLYAGTFGAGWSPFEDPIQGLKKLAILSGSVKFPTQPPYRFSPELRRLIESMLVLDPKKRPSVGSLLSAGEAWGNNTKSS